MFKFFGSRIGYSWKNSKKWNWFKKIGVFHCHLRCDMKNSLGGMIDTISLHHQR